MSDPDAEVLSRIIGGDKQAVRVLYTRHATMLFRFLIGIVKSEAIAEELVNETFIDVWRKADTFGGKSRVSSWIFAIGRNKALSTLRKRQDSALDHEFAEAIPDDADTAHDTLAKLDKAEAMRGCVALLSIRMREVVDLVYYQEKRISEVAEILDIPENTVKTRLFHARKALSEHFRRAGIDRGWP